MSATCEILIGDCLKSMRDMPDNSVDSVVTDPPYGLGFMGKAWDKGVPSVEARAKSGPMTDSNWSGDERFDGAPLPNARNHHPTVKPTALMRYLCRLVTPPGGTVLDPFAGSGSTGKAALLEGFSAILCEIDSEMEPIIRGRTNVTPGLGI